MDPIFQSLAEKSITELVALADQSIRSEHIHLGASALDRAFGLRPSDEKVRRKRQEVLDRLSVVENGITYRYIPAGSFLMGSAQGDPDERPVHPVELGHFWMAETPISWADYCRLMDWEPPPDGLPKGIELKTRTTDRTAFWRIQANKIRLQYCEDQTERARDWHAHALGQQWKKGKDGSTRTSQEMFGHPQRHDPNKPWDYQIKPMVAVEWAQARELCSKLSSADLPKTTSWLGSIFTRSSARQQTESKIKYLLPTEAEWEKAARGGLIGCRYSWGDEPPEGRCDFARFDEFSILPSKQFAPNGYGLYAMSGGVWEWTADWYDAEFYAQSPAADPAGPPEGKQRVVRGGSWADCAEAVTVSYRSSMEFSANPNIGFRICRVEM